MVEPNDGQEDNVVQPVANKTTQENVIMSFGWKRKHVH